MRRGTGALMACGLIGGSLGYAGAMFQETIEKCTIPNLEALPPPSFDAIGGTETLLCSANHPNCDESTSLYWWRQQGNMEYTTLDRIPKVLIEAFFANEDRTFETDNQIVISEVGTRIVGRNLINSVKSGSLTLSSGASNITMQFVRNNWPEVMPKSDFCRKLAEISIGQAWLEANAGPPVQDANGRITYPGKNVLLEQFLNEINFGRGTRGVRAAAEQFYNVPLEQITLEQAADMAGSIQSPDFYDGSSDLAKDPQQRAWRLERRNVTLDNMAEAGYITTAEAASNKQLPASTTPYAPYNQGLSESLDQSRAAALGARHFAADIKEEVMSTLNLDEVAFRNNLIINSTLNESTQNAIFTAIHTVSWPQDGRQIAAVMLAQDGRVLGEYGGAWDASQVNLAERPGQVGSSEKPYYYATALQNGIITADQTFVEDPNFTWPGNNVSPDFALEEGSHCHVPQACTLIDAIEHSSNPVPLQIARDNPGLLEAAAQTMEDYHMESDSIIVPTNVLGTREIDTYDLAEGMNGLIGNQGVAQDAHDIMSVMQVQDGQLVAIDNGAFAPAAPVRVNSPEVAAVLTEAMRGTVREGTAARSLSTIGTDTAGKTGTVDQNKGAYFTGVVATAIGNVTLSVGMRDVDEPRPMGDGTVGGGIPAQIFGAAVQPMIDDTNRRIN